MTPDLALTLLILAAVVTLFITEALRVDLAALMGLGALMLLGILTPERGLAGFANPATVAVACMFVVSAGVYRTGLLDGLGTLLARSARTHPWRGLALLLLAVGGVSAFVNNTAAVAVLLPVVGQAAREAGIPASRMLMPLSFAAMLGGLCTLFGTSTNLLVDQIARQHGLAGFGVFEIAPVGLVGFGVGIVYLLTVGRRLLPDRKGPADLTDRYELGDYLTEVVVAPDAAAAGTPLGASVLGSAGVDVVAVRRDGRMRVPTAATVLVPGDVLLVRGPIEAVEALAPAGLTLKGRRVRDRDLTGDDARLVEAVVAPNSPLDGRSLASVDFRNRYGATALAVRHRAELRRERLGRFPLRAGDVLLVEATAAALERLRETRDLLVVSERPRVTLRPRRAARAIAIVTAMVATAALGIFPLVVSALAAGVAMVLLRVLTLDEAYRAVDWRVVFLLAGVLALGEAVESTGGAALLAGFVGTLGTRWGLVLTVALVYVVTSVLTEVMSNNATAVLLAPVAIAVAGALGLDPKPLLVAVMLAASASFMTPVGYQTNTMVFAAGGYRFTDFTRVGAPLNLIMLGVAVGMIPWIWG